MTRIALVVAVLVVLPTVARADDAKMEEAKEAKAALSCQSILIACEAYMVSSANEKGTYPVILPELAKPPFGGASYLRDGEKDLLDPWGKMYQYAVAKDDKGELRAHVWTERTVDGKTRVIGRKPPEPKKK